MAIDVRTFDAMVDAILDRIVRANIGITDIGRSSFIRTLVEAIVAEIDSQNYTIGSIYDSYDVNTATGEDLDKKVSLLGVVRNRATPATGVARFYRSTPAAFDIPVEVGTIISTRPDSNGNVVEFKTTDIDKQIPTGSEYVDVNIEAVNPGVLYIPVGALCIVNDPIIGIDEVTNQSLIDGGTDDEIDDSLRLRSQQALAKLGKGTDTALEGAVKGISGVLDAMVVDMARGVGTSDIIVVTSSIPVPDDLADIIEACIKENKASGIDVRVIYPQIVSVDVSITLTNGDVGTAGRSIMGYFSKLSVGDIFMVSHVVSSVLSGQINSGCDVIVLQPTSNVVPTNSQVIRSGTITINGVVWNG